MMTSTQHTPPPPTALTSPPPHPPGSIQGENTGYDIPPDLQLVSDLPGNRVNTAITRMLSGVRLSSALWTDSKGATGGGGSSYLWAHQGGSYPRSRSLENNASSWGNYTNSTNDLSSPRARLLQRYADRGYEGVHQSRRFVSLLQKSEHANQRLKECLVDEVADNLRQQLGLLHLGVDPPGRNSSGSHTHFIQDREQNRTVKRRSESLDNPVDTTDDPGLGFFTADDNQTGVVSGEAESKGVIGAEWSDSKGDSVYTQEGKRRAPTQHQPRQGSSGMTNTELPPYNKPTPERQATRETWELQHATTNATSPLYILLDEGNQVRKGDTINNNTTKLRRARPKSLPPGVYDAEGLTGHTHLGRTMRTPSHTMECDTGKVTGAPGVQFLPGSDHTQSTHLNTSGGNSSSLKRARTRLPTTPETRASDHLHKNTPVTSGTPVIRGVPQSPSQTTLMIRDKRIPPMPSGRPPPLPPHLRDDYYSSHANTLEEDEIELSPQAQEDKAVEELGVVPDGVNKNHLPLLRAKKVFENELAERLEKKMEAQDQLLGDLRLCMERPDLREKVESTMRVVKDVIKTKINKDKNGNRIYCVDLDLGQFHCKVKHEVKDFVVEIEGSTFGPPETSLSKVIDIAFPESVMMEHIVIRQFGSIIEMEVPFKPNQLMTDLIDLVSKIDMEKEQQAKRNGLTSGGSLSSGQNSVSSCEQEEVEEQPLELPASPSPPVVVKKPRPMRRRRRSTLGSNSSDAISSVIGPKENIQNTTVSNTDVNKSKQNNDVTCEPDLDTYQSESQTTVLKNEPKGSELELKSGTKNTAGSGPQTGRTITSLITKKYDNNSKSLTVNQTSSVFAPDESTRTKLEFDDDDFFTIRHVSMHDDLSETDSGTAMDKKVQNNSTEIVSLSTEDTKLLSLKHGNEQGDSNQSPKGNKTEVTSNFNMSYHTDISHLSLLESESSVNKPLKIDSDIRAIDVEPSKCSFDHQPLPEDTIKEATENCNLCLDTGDAKVHEGKPSQVDLFSSVDALNHNESDVSMSEVFQMDSKENDLYVSKETSAEFKLDLDTKDTSWDKTNESNKKSKLHIIKIDSGLSKSASDFSDFKLDQNESKAEEISHCLVGVEKVGEEEVTNILLDTKKKVEEVEKDLLQKKEKAKDGETEMSQYESEVATLATSPLSHSLDLGKEPRKLFTTLHTSQRGEYKKDRSVTAQSQRVGVDKSETPSDSVEFYARPKCRERKIETECVSVRNAENSKNKAVIPTAKVEEYVRPKRKTATQKPPEPIMPTQEKVEKEEVLIPQRRRREREKVVIKKAQSLLEKVPLFTPKSGTDINTKFSRLQSDFYRKDPTKDLNVRKNLSTPKRLSADEPNDCTMMSNAVMISQPCPESKMTSDVVLRRKSEKQADSKPCFLRSKPDNVDLVELRRKRHSLDPGKLYRKQESDMSLIRNKTDAVSLQRSVEYPLQKQRSHQSETKEGLMSERSHLRQIKRLSLDSRMVADQLSGSQKDQGVGLSKSSVDTSTDNERVNKLRHMFENLGKQEKANTSSPSGRKGSVDQPGNTPPQPSLHRKFKSEFTLNL